MRHPSEIMHEIRSINCSLAWELRHRVRYAVSKEEIKAIRQELRKQRHSPDEEPDNLATTMLQIYGIPLVVDPSCV